MTPEFMIFVQSMGKLERQLEDYTDHHGRIADAFERIAATLEKQTESWPGLLHSPLLEIDKTLHETSNSIRAAGGAARDCPEWLRRLLHNIPEPHSVLGQLLQLQREANEQRRAAADRAATFGRQLLQEVSMQSGTAGAMLDLQRRLIDSLEHAQGDEDEEEPGEPAAE